MSYYSVIVSHSAHFPLMAEMWGPQLIVLYISNLQNAIFVKHKYAW